VIVVADTSVLINLCRIGQTDLLARLFQDVFIPTEVAAEFERLAAQVPRFGGLILPAWIRQQTPAAISAELSATKLDPGETAALALALEIHADALLVDERRGHEIAVQMGIKTIGVLGILLQAKRSGLIAELRTLLDQLDQDAGFWIAPGIRQRVLRLAGEG
jgi:predicted nucleic acid-binding protein